ncbi:MAG: hypothetical protein ACR2OZ_01090 [Verrucomicrobiales bacterium]
MKTGVLAAAAVCVFVLDSAVSDAAPKSNLTRETGAVYVEDFAQQPIKLRVKTMAPVYSNLRGERSLGTLVAGQWATLVAFTENACRVRGRASHGDVAGWVGINHLQPKDAGFFDRLKQIADRQRQVQEFIARKEVAIGMTPDEVLEALGKPDAESSRTDSNGQSLAFEYITYDRVPQKNLLRDRFGRLYETITYIKVETGRLTVNFSDEVVSSIESSKGKPNFGNAKIVVPPINIY